MPGHKRTKLGREEQLPAIAQMHLDGFSQREIAAHFGLDQSQICHDLKLIARRWKEPDPRKLMEIKNRLLTEIAGHKKAMKETWRNSLKQRETISKKQANTSGGVVGEGDKAKVKSDQERSEVSQKLEDPVPNVQAMRLVLDYLKLECEIHGLINRKFELKADEDAPPIRFIYVHEPPDVPRERQRTSTTSPEDAVDSPPLIPRFERPGQNKPSPSDRQPPTTRSSSATRMV
jgi:hypothetical protein